MSHTSLHSSGRSRRTLFRRSMSTGSDRAHLKIKSPGKSGLITGLVHVEAVRLCLLDRRQPYQRPASAVAAPNDLIRRRLQAELDHVAVRILVRHIFCLEGVQSERCLGPDHLKQFRWRAVQGVSNEIFFSGAQGCA